MSMTLCIKDRSFEIDDLNFKERTDDLSGKSVILGSFILKNCDKFPIELESCPWIMVDYLENCKQHFFRKISNSLVLQHKSKENVILISFVVKDTAPWNMID